jgi:NhaP-type Na+/H+ or K+/H+ antiporter
LRSAPHRHALMDDFLGLGLIGVVYGLSVLAGAWGFLAVFFAAVALRQTELKLAGVIRASLPLPIQPNSPADSSVQPHYEPPPTVSEGALVFKEHLERLSEVVLILLVGGTLFHNSWSWRVVGLVLFLFVVVRPVSVLVGLLATRMSWRMSWRMRGMMGWFGVRGIGSLYYLMYAIEHGLPESLALELIQFTLIAVTLSIILHGISVKPMMNAFQLRRKRPPTI